jgi:O-antigen/teichoic acid export membrane protein
MSGEKMVRAEREVAASDVPLATDPLDVLDTPSAGGKVIRGGALRAASYGAGLLLTVAAAAVMTRHLGVTDWGRYVTVLSLLAIVGSLSEAGMATIGVREYSVLHGAERDRMMRNFLGLRLAVAVVGVAAAVIFALVAGYDGVLVIGTLVAGLGLILNAFQQTISVPLSASLRLGWVSALDFLRQAAFVVLVFLLVAVGAGLFPFLVVALPVAALVLVATVPLIRGQAPLWPAFQLSEWAKVLRVTAAYAAASAVGTIYVSVTVILISLVGSQSETGYYSASFRVVSVLAVVPLLVVGAAFPVLARAARDDTGRHDYARERLVEVSLIVGVWMALSLFFGAGVAIRVIGGADFEPSVHVLQIQAFMMIGTFVAVALGFVLLSLRLHTELLLANLLALSTSIVLTIAFVPSMGAQGAAVATVVGEIGLALAYALALLRRRSGSLPLGIIPRVGLAAVLTLALILVPGLDDIPLVLAGTAVYFLTLAITGSIPRELPEALLAWRAGPPGSKP